MTGSWRSPRVILDRSVTYPQPMEQRIHIPHVRHNLTTSYNLLLLQLDVHNLDNREALVFVPVHVRWENRNMRSVCKIRSPNGSTWPTFARPRPSAIQVPLALLDAQQHAPTRPQVQSHSAHTRTSATARKATGVLASLNDAGLTIDEACV